MSQTAKRTCVPPTTQCYASETINQHGYQHTYTDQALPCPEIAGINVRELAAQHSSPLYVIVEETLRKKYRAAFTAISSRYPNVKFAWSYKTNYLKAVCNVFHQEGALAEIVSDFEYEKARNLGVNGPDIIFNGPYKNKIILRRAVAEGARIQVDNLDELTLLEQLAGEQGNIVPVGLRVNMHAGTEPVWDKFGLNFESGEAHRVVERIALGGRLRLDGLHMHLGTSILDLDTYGEGVEKLLNLARYAHEAFKIELKYINVGGGFASDNSLKGHNRTGEDKAPTPQQYASAICDPLLNNMPDYQNLPLLLFENGRALVDEAGFLITQVLSSKATTDGERAIIVDAGVNLLQTANWYRLNVHPVESTSEPVIATKVFGPLCMNIDILREHAPLPTLKPNDLLVIHPVGAYNITQSMQFITYRPRVVMLGANGEIDVIRDQESLETVESLEQLPDRLISKERSG